MPAGFTAAKGQPGKAPARRKSRRSPGVTPRPERLSIADAAAILALQRTAGNRAVSAVLGAGEADDGRAGVLQRQLAPTYGRFGKAMREDRARNLAIQSGKRAQGEEIVYLPDWNFLPRQSADKIFGERMEERTLFTIPIPQLGVRVDLRATADASLGLHASYSGALRKIQVGMDPWQAAVLRHLGTDAVTLAFFSQFARRVHGLAVLDIGGSIGLTATVSGSLGAVGKVVGLEVADVRFGIEAKGSAEAGLRLGGNVGFMVDRGDLRLRFEKAAMAYFSLNFGLDAYITASLLGFRWRKEWDLVKKSVNKQWANPAGINLRADGPPSAISPQMTFGDEQMQLEDLARAIFTAASSGEQLTPLNQPGGPGGGAGGGGGGAGGGGPAAPTGRTQSDPIPMIWYKSPGAYPPSIDLGGTRYFLTEPDYVPVPRVRDLADLRRDAERDSDGNYVIKIGVHPSSRNYPQVGRVWPRTRVGLIRGGDKQDQFRTLLTHYGYAWGSHQADHVRDLQWAGRDAYDNLWPLERARNLAANQILDQPVTYRNTSGRVYTVPLRQTPRNLYFRIIAYG